MPKKRFSAFEDFPVEENAGTEAPPSSLFEKPAETQPKQPPAEGHSIQEEQIADD